MHIGTLKNKKLIQCIIDNIPIFDDFLEIYLFGSILTDKEKPNDIDIFLIYDNYSKKISDEVTCLINYLENLTGFQIDVTALSLFENEDVNFLNRMKEKYLQIK